MGRITIYNKDGNPYQANITTIHTDGMYGVTTDEGGSVLVVLDLPSGRYLEYDYAV